MGGAFVGLADDWSAAYWNPAGLAFQSGWGVGESVDFISLRAHDGNSIANPIPPFTRSNINQGDPFFQFGGEPSRFNVTDTTIQAALPSLILFKVLGPWAMAAGVYSPLGFAFDWRDDSVPGIQAVYKDQGEMVMYNLSIARRLGPRWSLGAGVNWVDAQLERSAAKQTNSDLFQSSADGRGHALQGVFGLLAKLTNRLSMGLVYKTGQDISLGGTAVANDTQFPLTIPGFGTLTNETSRQTSTLHNPSTTTLGLAFLVTSSLTWTADWELTDWTPEKTRIEFDHPGAILQDQNFNSGWRATQRWRTGGEYRWNYHPHRRLSLHWGYTYDPYAIAGDELSLTNLVDVTRHVFTGGLSWRIGNWEPTIGFAYAEGARTVSDVVYKKVDRLLTTGIEYHIL